MVNACKEIFNLDKYKWNSQPPDIKICMLTLGFIVEISIFMLQGRGASEKESNIPAVDNLSIALRGESA